MTTEFEISKTLLALLVLLLTVHLGGTLATRLRQPPVVGEIIGGLVLGPTLLGWALPGLHREIFLSSARTETVMSMIYNFGLILLMFLSGLEMQSQYKSEERRFVVLLGLGACLLPLGVGLGVAHTLDMESHMGTAAHPLAMTLVFAIALSITSIPVIARIFMDLGIMQTPFAKLALSVSVLDDVILYVILAIALSLVAQSHEGAGWLQSQVRDMPFAVRLCATAIANLAFVALSVFAFRPLFGLLERTLFKRTAARIPVAVLLVVPVLMTLLAIRLGVPQVLGAFCGGLAASGLSAPSAADGAALKTFSFSFFIPIYFGIVGFRLNLAEDLRLGFVLCLLAGASAIKIAASYFAAIVAGATRALATNMAVVLNARGGPCIVLASVALDAGIVNRSFYTSLIVLALATSVFAGAWLQRVLKRGDPLM